MHSLAVCLLIVSFITICYGAPHFFEHRPSHTHHPLRKYPAEENAMEKRCKSGVLLFFPHEMGWVREEGLERNKGLLVTIAPEEGVDSHVKGGLSLN